jgi:preprotein translocase subunit SecD
LPAKITIINEKQLGSIFDKQVLSSAFIAVLICMTCVLLVMVARYRHFGCIAFIALILNFLLTFSILSLFGFTLTLPGIAGFVLMLGMAIDANILIYEKMKDLKRQGVNMPDTLIKNSFSKAIGTILDSNITTMIAGIALFSFGGSFIKGFSITLIFGLLCSIFTSVNITRMIIEEIYKNRKTISI